MSEPPATQPATTAVSAPMRRPAFTPGMFEDITGPDHPLVGQAIGKPCWTLTFAGELDEDTVTAIADRMASTDDADQDQRAALRDLRDAATEGGDLENLRALALALADYRLDRPIEDPGHTPASPENEEA